MKMMRIVSVVAGLAMMALPSSLFAQTLWRMDVNGTNSGWGPNPRVGTLDTNVTGSSVIWTTSTAGTATPIAWPGKDWPTTPDHILLRAIDETTQAAQGTYTAANPSHIITVVGTQVVNAVFVTHGGAAILTGGVIRVNSSGPFRVGENTAHNTLLVYSDVQYGQLTNTPAAIEYTATSVGAPGTVGANNNTLRFFGEIYGYLSSGMQVGLQAAQNDPSVGISRIILEASSVIHNGNSTDLFVPVGRAGGGANSNNTGRVEFHGTNTYTGWTRFVGGTTVAFTDAMPGQPGAFGTSAAALQIG
ncbi:MAG: hypothetical protein U1E27_08460, partial [Kiritimatiellia bacterium]|nr:hypothetical protein [Kiritimatiellia bacterium]